MTEVKKEATKVNKKLTDLTEKMDNIEMQIKMIVYVGIGILSLNVLMSFIYIVWGSWWFEDDSRRFLILKNKIPTSDCFGCDWEH